MKLFQLIPSRSRANTVSDKAIKLATQLLERRSGATLKEVSASTGCAVTDCRTIIRYIIDAGADVEVVKDTRHGKSIFKMHN